MAPSTRPMPTDSLMKPPMTSPGFLAGHRETRWPLLLHPHEVSNCRYIDYSALAVSWGPSRNLSPGRCEIETRARRGSLSDQILETDNGIDLDLRTKR